ncbi:MAG: phosphoglycerate transporter [Dehalococcoidia bacterium]|nr:phosphoglycerate transporter [Dehalococcoidia bacterium]
MLRIGWFATGRGEGSQKLLRAAVDAIRDRTLDAQISVVFSNRDPGQFPITDVFFDQVRAYGIPLVTLSDRTFRREHGGEVARAGEPLPAWREAYDRSVAELIAPYPFDLGVLAGYMLITTAPLYEAHPLLNLHPSGPGQPAGTWQDVTWQLIEQRADHGGVRIHLVTGALDAGAIVTYCTYPLRGSGIDVLWGDARQRSTAELREREGEDNALFQEIRRRGSARELPLIVETLRGFADGRLRLDDGHVMAGDTRIVGGYDLTPEIERSLADAAVT